MRNSWFLISGIIAPIVFWLTTIICGLMTENYNHIVNLVSELGYLGSDTQYIFTTGLIITSIMSILFLVGLLKTAKESGLSIIPILLILTFSFSVAGAAIFPMPTRLHELIGSPVMVFPLSPLLAAIMWQSTKVRNIKLFGGITLLFMILGFSTMMPEILKNYFGLKQRFFHIGWTFWFIYLYYAFKKIERSV